MLNIAVLGCGRIGRMHADNIARHADAELAMVYDVHVPSASAVAEQHGVPAASSPQDIFFSVHVDAVLVATTTETHADFIEMAVAAGKPVLCEKPIDLSLARVNACAERISGSDVLIQLGFNRRFDPGHRAARQGLLNGDIGDLHQVIITSRDPEMPPPIVLRPPQPPRRRPPVRPSPMAAARLQRRFRHAWRRRRRARRGGRQR